MQTFLPFKNYIETAKCLDVRRLGKQRIECITLIKLIKNRNFTSPYANHPACRMWRDYLPSLISYTNEIIIEWIRRGYRDTQLQVLKELSKDIDGSNKLPKWLELNEEINPLIQSHRSKLLQKNYNEYCQYCWNVPLTLPYYWPE